MSEIRPRFRTCLSQNGPWESDSSGGIKHPRPVCIGIYIYIYNIYNIYMCDSHINLRVNLRWISVFIQAYFHSYRIKERLWLGFLYIIIIFPLNIQWISAIFSHSFSQTQSSYSQTEQPSTIVIMIVIMIVIKIMIYSIWKHNLSQGHFR